MTELVVLTAPEMDLLEECEHTIERGLRTFNEVGAALMSIRDNRLYRTDFPTFEVYAQVRWGLSKTHANRLVAAAGVLEILAPVGAEINSEAQARELAPLLEDPEELREVWAETLERTAGQPTAAAIREVREERQDLPEKPASDPGPPVRSAGGSGSKPWNSSETALLYQVRRGETVVVSLRGEHQNLIAWAESEGKYVRVDRRTEWGNPFELPADGDRDTVIRNYAEHYLPNKPSLMAKLPTLRGKVLGCWCAPEPCHGDVLRSAARP